MFLIEYMRTHSAVMHTEVLYSEQMMRDMFKGLLADPSVSLIVVSVIGVI